MVRILCARCGQDLLKYGRRIVGFWSLRCTKPYASNETAKKHGTADTRLKNDLQSQHLLLILRLLQNGREVLCKRRARHYVRGAGGAGLGRQFRLHMRQERHHPQLSLGCAHPG